MAILNYLDCPDISNPKNILLLENKKSRIYSWSYIRLSGDENMLINNKVYNHRKKQQRQLERERLAKEHKTIKKPKKRETCQVYEL